MSTLNEITTVIAAGTRDVHVESSRSDLNEALRALALSDGTISFRFELAAELPSTAASAETVRNVVLAILDYARNAIQRTGRPGAIGIQTEPKPGRVVCSFTYRTHGLPPLPDSADMCFNSTELTECGGIVRDEHGDMYVWRPRTSDRVTITIELPAQ